MEGIVGVNKIRNTWGHFVELILNSFEHFECWRKIIVIFFEIFFGKLSFEHLRKKKKFRKYTIFFKVFKENLEKRA